MNQKSLYLSHTLTLFSTFITVGPGVLNHIYSGGSHCETIFIVEDPTVVIDRNLILQAILEDSLCAPSHPPTLSLITYILS